MNRVRAANGLQELRLDPRLLNAARAHSADMVRRTYFSHGAFAERLRRFNVSGPVIGENLAWGSGEQASPGTIVRRWLESAPHRRILLRPGFSLVGVGAVAGTFAGQSDATVVTADFAGQ